MYSTPEDKQTLLINLSTIHGLAPISKVLSNFAKLHYQYAKGRLHFKWYSQAWVLSKYLAMTRLINDYKLGEIKTEQFIERLLDIFNFLKGKENADTLLKEAWNSLITWNDKSTKRLKILLDNKQPIYFISNTNLLNIEKIIEFFNQNSDITWQLPEEQTKLKPLKIAEHFFLCPSYLFKEFKEGTPGLIHDVVNFLKYIRLENILLVSQYQRDLDKAKEEAIKWQLADRFFNDRVPRERLSSQSSLNNSLPVTNRIPTPLNPLSNKLAMNNRQSLFSHSTTTDEQNAENKLSEETPLLPSVKQ